VTAYNGTTPLDNSNINAALSGSRFGVTDSVGTIILDPVKAFGGTKVAIADFRVELELSDSAANVNEVLYKIYDLASGACTDVTRADLMNGKYGTIETNYTAFTTFDTPVSDVLIWTGVTNDAKYATTHLVLRKIPAAGQTFTMGSPSGEIERGDTASVRVGGTVSGGTMTGGETVTASGFETQHSVSFTQDYYMGVFEVTQYQYWKIMGVWPSNFSNGDYKDTRPVEKVSYDNIRGGNGAGTTWPDVATHEVLSTSFLGTLRVVLSGSPKLDLPTEAQWEYACRAKSTTAWYSGYNPPSVSWEDNPSKLRAIGRFRKNGGEGATATDDTTKGTAKVGSYLPNAWGLYDMLGNVQEWSLDWYAPFAGDAVANPNGALQSEASFVSSGGNSAYNNRVARGGGYGSRAADVRAAYRKPEGGNQTAAYRGFRLCLTIEE
jgi:formylglycine-generating enzyme required for sulfatase activity